MRNDPLSGIRIAVTRARAQADELARPLKELGAEVLVAPLIRIEPLIATESVRAAVHDLRAYDWLVLTSANGVELFAEAMQSQGQSIDGLARIRVGCVGAMTAAVAAHHGIVAEIIPDEFADSSLAEVLVTHVGAGARVLLARAAGASAQLPRQLTEHGAKVDEVELYRSVPDVEGTQLLRNRISAGQVDLVTFTSGSTVRYFSEAVGELAGALVAVIGPSTAEVAKQYDIPVSIEAKPHTARGLVHAISEYFRRAERPTEE